MANYNSSHVGNDIDTSVSKILTVDGDGGLVSKNFLTNTLEDYITQDDLTLIQNRLSILETIIFTRARYNGSGDTTFSGWIPFNTIEINIGNGIWSNGQFIIPSNGIYIANFTNYSNSPTSGRTAVAHLNSAGSSLEMNMVNANQSASITGIYKCAANERLVAGAYNSGYPISIYAADGHNEFTIMKLINY